MNASQQRIRGFDGLRALAFLLVFVSHKVGGPLAERYGTAGVWLFFVLSGFLITRILARSRGAIEEGRGRFRGELLNFYLRRTLRIFPVYYLFLGVVTVLSVYGLIELGSRGRQLSYWVFLANVFVETRGWATDMGHLWSLAVEEQFYLLFAPLALAVPRRRLALLCVALVLVSLAAHRVFWNAEGWQLIFDANSFVNFGLLAIGGLAGLAADRPLPKGLNGDLVMVAMLGLFLVLPWAMPSLDLWLKVGRLGGVFVALLLVQVYQRQESRIVSVLNWAPLREIGIVSYGAYLFHPVIHLEGALEALGLGGEVLAAVRPPAELAVTIALAELSWRLLETPVRNLGVGRAAAARLGNAIP